ncbi:MAG TPA: PaaI family thioesterase [Casimicrobiaceae bacterium]|nr:PaaI family thioesterase [Casimicrobiaceae bacterium]
MTPEELSAAGWKRHDSEGLMHSVGPLWTLREGSSFAYGVLADARHLNPAGVVHGGLFATLADHALTAIVWQAVDRRACVTVALDVHFLVAARPGDFIIARGRIDGGGTSLFFASGELSVKDSRVATAHAVIRAAR